MNFVLIQLNINELKVNFDFLKAFIEIKMKSGKIFKMIEYLYNAINSDILILSFKKSINYD